MRGDIVSGSLKILLLAASLASCSAFASRRRSIKVEGMAFLEVPCDTASIDLSVREDVGAIDGVRKTADYFGVSEDDVVTLSFRLSDPSADGNENEDAQAAGTAEAGEESRSAVLRLMRISVRDCAGQKGLERLGSLLASLSAIDGVGLERISRSVSNGEELVSRIRIEAAEMAMRKCADYAKGSGMRVGKVSSAFENYSTIEIDGDEVFGSGNPFDRGSSRPADDLMATVKASVSLEVEMM